MSILSAPIEIPKKLRELNDRLPGGTYVALLLWLLSALLLRFHLPESIEVLPIVITLTTVLYYLGRSADEIYDMVFAPKTDHYLGRLGPQMREARTRAAWFLETGKRDWTTKDKPQHMEGMYKKAEALYGATTAWEQQIKWQLQISKALRSFIIPCLLIFVYDFWSDLWPKLTPPDNLFKAFTFLAAPWAPWASLMLGLIGTHAESIVCRTAPLSCQSTLRFGGERRLQI